MPRGMWRVGKIEKLNPSADGQIRTVDLRLVNGRTVKRPIKLLYPLEMAAEPRKDDTRESNRLCPVWTSDGDEQHGFLGFSDEDARETEDLLKAYDMVLGSDNESESGKDDSPGSNAGGGPRWGMRLRRRK